MATPALAAMQKTQNISNTAATAAIIDAHLR